MSLFNPYSAFSVLGVPQLPSAPPTLRVMEGEASAAQLRAAQNAFTIFCTNARLSAVPNPSHAGRLADGSTFRIDVIGGQSIMRLWPVIVEEEELPQEKLYGGVLITYETPEGELTSWVLTNEGTWERASGVWTYKPAALLELYPMIGMYTTPTATWSGGQPDVYAVANARLVRRTVSTAAIASDYGGLRTGSIIGARRAKEPSETSRTRYEFLGGTLGGGTLARVSGEAEFDLFFSGKAASAYIPSPTVEEILVSGQTTTLEGRPFRSPSVSLNGNGIVHTVAVRGREVLLTPPALEPVNSRTHFIVDLNPEYSLSKGEHHSIGTPYGSAAPIRYPDVELTQDTTIIYAEPTIRARSFRRSENWQPFGAGNIVHESSFTGTPVRFSAVLGISTATQPFQFSGSGFEDGGNGFDDSGGASSGTRTWTLNNRREWADDRLTTVRRNGAPAVVVAQETHEYHHSQGASGSHSTDMKSAEGGTYANDAGSGWATATRRFKKTVVFPHGRSLVEDFIDFSETASCSWSMSWSRGDPQDTYTGNSNRDMSYSLQREYREILVYDPDFNLIVYKELVYSISKSFTESNSTNSYHLSEGGAIPLPSFFLVIESKHGSRRLEIVEPPDTLTPNGINALMCSRAPSVGVAPGLPALSGTHDASLDIAKSYGIYSDAGHTEGTTGGFPSMLAFPPKNEEHPNKANIRGAVPRPLSFVNLEVGYEKCPHTGGGVLIIQGYYEIKILVEGQSKPNWEDHKYFFPGNPETSFVIDDTGIKPLSSVLPEIADSQRIRGLQAV